MSSEKAAKKVTGTFRVTFDFAVTLTEPEEPTLAELKKDEDPVLARMRGVREKALMQCLMGGGVEQLREAVMRELVAEEVAFALDERLVAEMGVDPNAVVKLIHACPLNEDMAGGLIEDYGTRGLRVFYSGVKVDLVGGGMERLE